MRYQVELDDYDEARPAETVEVEAARYVRKDGRVTFYKRVGRTKREVVVASWRRSVVLSVRKG
jgi:hypothetical protein